MQLLAEIKDRDFLLDHKEDKVNYPERKTARAVIFDQENMVAILHGEGDHGYYVKLPGGGLEAGESILAALIRECLEETGCYLQNISELGLVKEFRQRDKKIQISYAFLAWVKGVKGEPSFDEGEKAHKFRVEWHSLPEAIAMFKKAAKPTYHSNFVISRELAILEKAQAVYARS